MGRRKKIYALYKGDDYICEGTVDELAERSGRTAYYLMWSYHYKPFRNTIHRWGYSIIPIEGEDEC